MDLVIIDTPLQLLNAIEARAHFGIGPCPLLLLKWNFWPKPAFERLLGEIEWESVSWHEMEAVDSASDRWLAPQLNTHLKEYLWTLRQFARRRNLEKRLRQYGRVERLFAGSLINMGYMCHVVNYVPAAEIVAVDDGTFTLDVATLRKGGMQAHRELPAAGPVKRLKRMVRERYVDWRTQQPGSMTFFTAYDVSFGQDDRVVPNSYNWLRARATKGSSNGEIYFLGQPLVEDGYLREETYFAYLEKVARYFAGEPVFYLPHKRESSRTVSLVETRLQLPIKRFTEPIEVALALGTDLPAVLASFHCSALESCARIFGDAFNIRAFYLPAQALLCDRESVEDVYHYFRKNQKESFQVIEV